MKQTILLTISLLLSIHLFAASQWTSKAIGKAITYKINEATKPATDASGKKMTVVYLENLGFEKVGQYSNAENVTWLKNQGYRVIELDYVKDAQAVSPNLTKDIIAINDELNSGTFCGATNISNCRSYILMEGYRIQRDVAYYKDDKSVYNLYSQEDSLYMDIVYPANPKKAVPTLLSFSYSNSYPGKQHQRLFLCYTLSMFDDAILEGAAANGMAWAIADHPKYCDWGNGKVAGGANKSLASIEVNPDAAKKVKAAIRTLRHFGSTAGLGNDVALYGFSRGSTAASLGIGDNPNAEWLTSDRCPYETESSDIQAAVLGPGVFNYGTLPNTQREYTNMKTYAGTYSATNALWQQQGGALAIKNAAVPAFLFYNTSDEAYYGQQMKELMELYDKTGSTYELLTDYGSGHSVPTDAAYIQKIYDFLNKHLTTETNEIKQFTCNGQVTDSIYDISGRKQKKVSKGLYINRGKKYIKQ